MKSIVVLFLIIAFMIIGWIINGWVQRIIKPRQSFIKLILYFLFVLALVFVLSFLLVFIIAKLYPGELIK